MTQMPRFLLPVLLLLAVCPRSSLGADWKHLIRFNLRAFQAVEIRSQQNDTIWAAWAISIDGKKCGAWAKEIGSYPKGAKVDLNCRTGGDAQVPYEITENSKIVWEYSLVNAGNVKDLVAFRNALESGINKALDEIAPGQEGEPWKSIKSIVDSVSSLTKDCDGPIASKRQEFTGAEILGKIPTDGTKWAVWNDWNFVGVSQINKHYNYNTLIAIEWPHRP